MNVNEPVAMIEDLEEGMRHHFVYELGMDWKDPLYLHPPQAITEEVEALRSLYEAIIRYENLSSFNNKDAITSCKYQLYDAKEKAKVILNKTMGNGM